MSPKNTKHSERQSLIPQDTPLDKIPAGWHWPLRAFEWSVYGLAFAAPVSIVAAQFFAGLILVFGHILLLRGVRRWRLHTVQSALILTFLTVLLLSAVLSTNFNAAIPQLKKSWPLFCFFPLAVLGWSYSGKKMALALIWGTVAASAIGIARYLGAGIERAAPFSGGYTTLAIFEAAVLPLMIVQLKEWRTKRWVLGGAALIVLAGLAMTETRAGWLAALVGIIIIGTFLNKKATVISLGTIGILALALPQTRGIVERRFAVDREGGFSSGRILLWSQALKTLPDMPVLGYGPGSFRRLAPQEILDEIGDRGISSWHSTPLDILIESGPLALAAIFGAFLIPAIIAWREFRARAAISDGLGVFAALAAVYVAGLTTNLLRDFLLICLLVILWAGAYRGGNSAIENARSR